MNVGLDYKYHDEVLDVLDPSEVFFSLVWFLLGAAPFPPALSLAAGWLSEPWLAREERDQSLTSC